MLDRQREMFKSLENPEYRREFVSEHINVGLAFQIRQMRESRKWTQEELAQRTGKVQETISAWENPDYGRYSLSTLKTLATAFDVALLVKFVSFSELVNWSVGLTRERLAPPSYEDERLIPNLDSNLATCAANQFIEFVVTAPNYYQEVASGTSTVGTVSPNQAPRKELAYALR